MEARLALGVSHCTAEHSPQGPNRCSLQTGPTRRDNKTGLSFPIPLQAPPRSSPNLLPSYFCHLVRWRLVRWLGRWAVVRGRITLSFPPSLLLLFYLLNKSSPQRRRAQRGSSGNYTLCAIITVYLTLQGNTCSPSRRRLGFLHPFPVNSSTGQCPRLCGSVQKH